MLGLAAIRPAQQEAGAALASGRDCLAGLPSAAGESAIYQIAAITLGRPAVVVSPPLALQRDQLVTEVVSGRHLLEPAGDD